MNIIQLSTSDIAHGAGIAAFRLHQALNQANHSSHMLVNLKLSNLDTVSFAKSSSQSKMAKVSKQIKETIEQIFNRIGPQNAFSFASLGLVNHTNIKQADLIHIHNIHWNKNNFSPAILPKLSALKPTVWTLHDMWPLTGHCIYSFDCMRWQAGCGNCPDLSSYISLDFDTTAWLYRIKKRLYKKSQLSIVTPSQWLQGLAQQSPLLDSFDIHCIPNGIDTNVFKPKSKTMVRQLLDIDLNSQVILFMTSNNKDTRKGYQHFEDAILQLHRDLDKPLLLSLGSGGVSKKLKQYFDIKEMGYVSNEQLLALIYCAADILVFPTLADNLPNIILESQACGTPVISFDVGGVPEMIKHLKTGYLAKFKDANDLAHGIKILLQDAILRKRISEKAIEVIQENFTSKLCAKRHLELYQNCIDKNQVEGLEFRSN